MPIEPGRASPRSERPPCTGVSAIAKKHFALRVRVAAPIPLAGAGTCSRCVPFSSFAGWRWSSRLRRRPDGWARRAFRRARPFAASPAARPSKRDLSGGRPGAVLDRSRGERIRDARLVASKHRRCRPRYRAGGGDRVEISSDGPMGNCDCRSMRSRRAVRFEVAATYPKNPRGHTPFESKTFVPRRPLIGRSRRH